MLSATQRPSCIEEGQGNLQFLSSFVFFFFSPLMEFPGKKMVGNRETGNLPIPCPLPLRIPTTNLLPSAVELLMSAATPTRTTGICVAMLGAYVLALSEL
jgi:hypothetical protein